MATESQTRLFPRLLPLLMACIFVLSACALGAPAAAKPTPTASSAPTIASQPATSTPPEQTELPAPTGSPSVSIDTSGMASGIQTETIPAVTDTNNAPYWEILPAYTRLTLQGYSISSSLLQPQIFVYPVQDLLKINEGTAGIVASLQALLQVPQDLVKSNEDPAGNITSLQSLLQSPVEVKDMPFLPLYNAAQMMHAKGHFLDFKNGRGIRFLTEFSQGIVPINNHDLIYTFQGLTGDGRYYIAAVLPVTHPSLPADYQATVNLPPEFTSNYPTYIANMAKSLNSQAANTFSPDLSRLDAIISSIEIK